MSLRKGTRQKSVKHQNVHAFRHNKKSKMTAKILASPNQGLCQRCYEKIEWRKKYRKYKPLKVPGKCTSCSRRAVTRAYHTLCDDCASDKGVCGWCQQAHSIVLPVQDEKEAEREEIAEEALLASMNLRQRRTYLRKLYRGNERDNEESNDNDNDNEREDGSDSDSDSGKEKDDDKEEEPSEKPDGSKSNDSEQQVEEAGPPVEHDEAFETRNDHVFL
jgi:Uncharacterized conserved protein (DUF2039)